MTWQDKITFGKYKDFTLLQAFTIDKQYFGWLYRSIENGTSSIVNQAADICNFLGQETTKADKKEMGIEG